MLVCPEFSSDNLSKHRTTIRTIKEEGSSSLPFYTMLRSPGRNRVSKIWLYAITKVSTLYFVIIGLGNLNSCRCEWKYTSTCCLLKFLSKWSLKLVLSLYFVTWRQLSLSKNYIFHFLFQVKSVTIHQEVFTIRRVNTIDSSRNSNNWRIPNFDFRLKEVLLK